jgi:hypothetical protein
VGTSTFIHFKYLWLIADEARARAERFANEHTPADFGQGPVAVVFAVAATEAYINEVSHLVKQDAYLYPDTPLVDFGAQMTQAVANKMSIEEKYLLASKLLGQPFQRGQKPFQDLVTVIAARNFLVHQIPVLSEVIANLEQVGIATKRTTFRNYLDEDEPMGSQVDALSNPTVARWACDTAANIIVAVMDMFPPCASASVGLLRSGFPPET